MELIVAYLTVAFAFAALGSWIAREKGRSTFPGAVIGFLFGPLGCLILALLSNEKRQRSPIIGYSRHARGADLSEPDEMPEDWGKPASELAKKQLRKLPDDGVNMDWLQQ